MTDAASAAEYSILTSEDPFDQELTQALGPLLEPIVTLLSRTPAISNLLGGPFGVNSTLVRVFRTDVFRTDVTCQSCNHMLTPSISTLILVL